MKVNNKIFFALVEEQLKECPQVRITLQGTSMFPTLKQGDVLTLGRVDVPPTVGDVVLFRCGECHLLHRVVRRVGDCYCMQGDNNYSCEQACGHDLVAVLNEVRRGATVIDCQGESWRRKSRKALRRSAAKRLMGRWFSRPARRRLRPYYFALLAFLMWAPLNGLGIPLDNYILGLRADHLLHASVFLPCTLFLMDLFARRKAPTWLAAVGVALLTEGVQYLLPYRGFDINDLVANTLGVTVGWVAILLAYSTASRSALSQ